ncbi:hypothetical protein COB52_05810 [Candidatus Kaiserbacteria bacterium]|nr:MAG: hypothetical protein COB52_05810 [Candidatus Kaiserbacteria bacterium]
MDAREAVDPYDEYDDDQKKKRDSFKCADFLVSDTSAMVCMLQSFIFEEIDPSKKRGETIFHGLKSKVNAIAVHPTKPILAMAGKSGFIITWNYLTKETLVNNFESFDKE